MQVPEGTDSECIECTFLPEKRTHWSCRDCIQSTAGSCRHSGALSPSCSWKRMLEFLLWFVILKNKKLTNKNKTVAARLGDDFEMGQSSNDFIYRFREEQAS